MTTRARLESEREALAAIRYGMGDNPATLAKRDALTASIARVDALLGLSDEQAAYLVTHEVAIAYADEDDAEHCDDVPAGELRPSETAAAHRTVAEIVRRS